MSANPLTTCSRCVVAFEFATGRILGVHFLPEIHAPLPLETFQNMTRSHVALRSGMAEENVRVAMAESSQFASGKRLRVDSATGLLKEGSLAEDVEFGYGTQSALR